MTEFRPLRAEEVECRVAQVDKYNLKWLQLLLYKDARCDQNILDETVGPMDWQRHHSRDNANCIVSIWDENKKQWIEKEDTGTESNTEAQKGLASDSFKRACFNWGIGRELYTAPTIFVYAVDRNGERNFEWRTDIDGKPVAKPKEAFYVSTMETENGRIVFLEIRNKMANDRVVFAFGQRQDTKTWKQKVGDVLKSRGVDISKADNWKPNLPTSCNAIPIGKETTERQWQFIYEELTGT